MLKTKSRDERLMDYKKMNPREVKDFDREEAKRAGNESVRMK